MPDYRIEFDSILAWDKLTMADYIIELTDRIEQKKQALDYYENRSYALEKLCRDLYAIPCDGYITDCSSCSYTDECKDVTKRMEALGLC